MNLLNRLGLARDFSFDLPATDAHFTERFRRSIDASNDGLFGDSFGSVGGGSFRLRRVRRTVAHDFGSTKITGDYRTGNARVIVTGTATISSYLPGIVTNVEDPSMAAFAIPFLAVHALLTVGFPYVLLRRIVKLLPSDLERELYYVAFREKY